MVRPIEGELVTPGGSPVGYRPGVSVGPNATAGMILTLNDGSVWKAEYDKWTDKITLLHQLHGPSGSGGTKTVEIETPTTAEKEPMGGKSSSEIIEESIKKMPPMPMPATMPGFSPAKGILPNYEKDDLAIQPRNNDPGKLPNIPRDVQEKMHDTVFQTQLRNVMLDNRYDRRVRGRTRGKLDMGRLFKVPTGSRTVFTQKMARKNKHYNVVLVVDESGSMRGKESECAAETTLFLAKSLMAIGIDVAIVGFNKYINVRKEFDTPLNERSVYWGIESTNHGNGAGSNNDYDALNMAYHMLDNVPREGKNIVLFISDGQPASSDNYAYFNIKGDKFKPFKHRSPLDAFQKDQKEHLHHLVKANDHRATSVGIGIYEGGWQIPENFVIEDLKDLKGEIIKTLRKNIKRG